LKEGFEMVLERADSEAIAPKTITAKPMPISPAPAMPNGFLNGEALMASLAASFQFTFFTFC
jgi:hypothetical protein